MLELGKNGLQLGSNPAPLKVQGTGHALTVSNNLIANAIKGRDGNIQITTQGIFGLKFRDRLTPENDITASSQFGVSRTVQVNTVGVGSNPGLVELPANVSDPWQQIAIGCVGTEGRIFSIQDALQKQ